MERHLVITPVKDEEQFIQHLISSMMNQKQKPDLWVIVDDSSEDRTKEIVNDAVNAHDWIVSIDSEMVGERSRGQRIARLFIKGINSSTIDWDYCSKVDADMVLPPDYFEEILHNFRQEDQLGICSGNCYYVKGREKILEKVMPTHTRGGLKTYRRACFDDIGGVKPVNGWDGIDDSLAQIKGWKTKNLESLLVQHQRETGSLGGVLSSFELGKRSYFIGYDIFYISLKSIHHGYSRMNMASSFLMMFGYIFELVRFIPRYGEKEFRRKMRRNKYRQLLEVFIKKGQN